MEHPPLLWSQVTQPSDDDSSPHSGKPDASLRITQGDNAQFTRSDGV